MVKRMSTLVLAKEEAKANQHHQCSAKTGCRGQAGGFHNSFRHAEEGPPAKIECGGEDGVQKD